MKVLKLSLVDIDIGIDILHTVLFTFPMEQTRRICQRSIFDSETNRRVSLEHVIAISIV